MIITPGILTKVSFGVRIPEREKGGTGEREKKITSPGGLSHSGPSHKPSISQSSDELKPRLSVTAEFIEREKGRIHFSIDCNYFLFVKRAELKIFDENQKVIKTIELPMPLPLRYEMPLTGSSIKAFEDDSVVGVEKDSDLRKLSSPKSFIGDPRHMYYQLSVFNASGKEDRTSIGQLELTS